MDHLLSSVVLNPVQEDLMVEAHYLVHQNLFEPNGHLAPLDQSFAHVFFQAQSSFLQEAPLQIHEYFEASNFLILTLATILDFILHERVPLTHEGLTGLARELIVMHCHLIAQQIVYVPTGAPLAHLSLLLFLPSFLQFLHFLG